METSIFNDKAKIPTEKDLEKVLGPKITLWHHIKEYIYQRYPKVTEEWNYPGVKYGWGFRIKDKKRAIIYFLPRENYFKVAFVFGHKAMDKIIESDISQIIIEELKVAKVYAEGRGIRIDVREENILKEIRKLIDIKIES